MRCGTEVLNELNPRDKHMMIRPIMTQGLLSHGYHANMPKTSGAERYIRPIAQVPMIAMLRSPWKGGWDV